MDHLEKTDRRVISEATAKAAGIKGLNVGSHIFENPAQTAEGVWRNRMLRRLGWLTSSVSGGTGTGLLWKVRCGERALPTTTGLHRQEAGLRAEHRVLCLFFLN